MLNLTKAAKETIYMKIMRVLLAMCFLVVPLVFFTDLTANPFFVQNVLLYVLIALLYGTLAVKFLRSKDIDFTKTFFDLAFFVYVITCIVGWLSAVSSAPQAMRQTMFYGLLNYGSLLVIVSLGAYMLSKNVVFFRHDRKQNQLYFAFPRVGRLVVFPANVKDPPALGRPLCANV